jgi:hypothetical protein
MGCAHRNEHTKDRSLDHLPGSVKAAARMCQSPSRPDHMRSNKEMVTP